MTTVVKLSKLTEPKKSKSKSLIMEVYKLIRIEEKSFYKNYSNIINQLNIINITRTKPESTLTAVKELIDI